MAARDPNVTFYFNTLDTTKSGKVFANDAATFFRRSGEVTYVVTYTATYTLTYTLTYNNFLSCVII